MKAAPAPHRPFYNFGKFAVIAGVGASFLTGAGWLVLDSFFQHEGDFGPERLPLQGVLLQLHGAIAMGMMMLLGGTLATHVRHYWRKRRSRKSGLGLAGTWILLMATAYLLYYSGRESVRSAAHGLHIALGLSLPVGLVVHILQKRRQPPPSSSRTTV